MNQIKIAKQLLKIAKNLLSYKKIQKNFQQQIQKAIDQNETILFDYVNKQGKYSQVQLKPIKIQRKWGKIVVTGITKYGKQFSYLLDSIGKKENEIIEEKKQKIIVLDDDCDFEKQLQKAIREESRVQFSYLMKNGNRIKVTMKPKSLEKKYGNLVCVGDTYSGQRNFSISSMGNNSMKKSEMYKEYPFLKDMIFYIKIDEEYYFFKAKEIVDDKILCDKYDSKVYESYFTDGEREDRYHSWQQKYIEYRTYPGRLIGQQLLEIKNDKLIYSNKELKSIKSDHHLYRKQKYGNRINYNKVDY